MKINLIVLLLGIALVNAKVTMIIRHGEKIKDGSINLSPKGEARAKCLINVFGPDGIYVSPEKIFAQRPTEKKKSTRPRDTVIPLAKALNITVDLTYSRHKTEELTNYIKSSPEEIILVSWSKERIPEIADKLGIYNPPTWKKAYDEIWIITDGTTNFLKNTNNNDNNNNNRNNKIFNWKSGFLKNQSKTDSNNFFFRIKNKNNNLKLNEIELTPEIYQGKNVTLKIYKQFLSSCISSELQNKTKN